jgi:hypothetical protein
MNAKPLRRRPRGSLLQVQKAVYAVLDYNLSVIEDDSAEHELKLRACTSLVQASLAWVRISELTDLEKSMVRLETLANNGSH